MTASDGTRPTILVVDDTPENLALITELLREQYRLRLAINGRDALRFARAAPQPDLILLDVLMSDMSGFEVCKHLQASPQTAGIPVIFLTALTSVDDEREGLHAGEPVADRRTAA